MIVMHIDMDAFFAAIEEREHPEFRDMPIVVGALPGTRGVVSTANYKAREYGIKSGMPISKAHKLCPKAIFLKPNFELYERESEKIMKIIKEFGDSFEQISIDEAFIDVSRKCKNFEEAKALALLLKQKIFDATSLTCSIGIASNKLLAKIASSINKPDGLTIVERGKEQEFLKDLKPDIIPGIGKKTLSYLKKLGIKKIADLQKKDIYWFLDHFGRVGIYYFNASRGIDKSKVEESYSFKSIGKEITFPQDISNDDIEKIEFYLKELCKNVWQEVRDEKIYFKTIEIKIRFFDFETHTREKTFIFPIDNANDFYEKSKEMLQGFLIKPIRLIGVRAKNFVKERQLKLKLS